MKTLNLRLTCPSRNGWAKEVRSEHAKSYASSCILPYVGSESHTPNWHWRIIATHNSPRVWFMTSALSPLIVRLIRLLLSHGDYVAAGLPPHEIEDDERSREFRELINECKSTKKDREGWKDRIRGIRCDGRIMGQCGAAVAEAVEVFGRIDILLCCTSEGLFSGLYCHE